MSEVGGVGVHLGSLPSFSQLIQEVDSRVVLIHQGTTVFVLRAGDLLPQREEILNDLVF